MIKKSLFLILITIASIFGLLNIVLGQEKDPSFIFAKVVAAYESMLTYQAEGKVNSGVDSGNGPIFTTTTFSMQLKKPNLYKISWTQVVGMGILQNGTVFSKAESTPPQSFFIAVSLGSGFMLLSVVARRHMMGSELGPQSETRVAGPQTVHEVTHPEPAPFAHWCLR